MTEVIQCEQIGAKNPNYLYKQMGSELTMTDE